MNNKNAQFIACSWPGSSDSEVYIPCEESESDTKLIYHSFKDWGIEVPVVKIDIPLSELQKKEFHNPPFRGRAEQKLEYLASINRLITQIQEDEFLEKVVLSRCHIQELNDNYRADLHFKSLAHSYPDLAVHWIRWKGVGEWIGASPEVLLEYKDNKLYTMALAGTLPLTSGEWTDKERREQETVSRFIRNKLLNSGWEIESEKGPYERKAGPVRHLESLFTAKGNGNIKAFLKELHPTPAVLGWPRDKALDCIHDNETYSRAFYSGYWGIEKSNSARFFVNLRCMSLHEGAAVFYVGGGINEASIAEREWQETEEKKQAIFAHLYEAKH
jgi:isochorismate synthase